MTASLNELEKSAFEVREQDATNADLVYDDEDEEPVFHHRTYLALLALFILNYVQVVALNGPPGIVSAAKRGR